MTKHSPFTNSEIITAANKYQTPFHLYDEATIRKTAQKMKSAFSWAPNFKNFFAVKANPNPHILQILKEEGMGGDCSSMGELLLCESVGLKGDDIMFTSNNTPLAEYKKALEMKTIINIDDISHLEFLKDRANLPECISARTGNHIIGDPKSAKFGLTREQIHEFFKQAKEFGLKRFGLHTMVVSNCLSVEELIETANMMFQLTFEIWERHNIKLEFLNLGGGIGIPYKCEDQAVDIDFLGRKVKELYNDILKSKNLTGINIYYECGRYITGNAGVLVTRVIHQKNTYKRYLGIDSCINSLMRPALYGSYHHITHVVDDNLRILKHLPIKRNIFNITDKPSEYDVVGSLCENNDKLATDRKFDSIVRIGDLLVFHDTGAHGHCMGFNYNAKLRVAEYLKCVDKHKNNFCCFLNNVYLFRKSSIIMIRRAETYKDLFRTIKWLEETY